jgi:hypothetical protein
MAKQRPMPRIRASTRVSVSIPNEPYGVLQKIAAGKKVSIAWVVRDAVEKYIEDQAPLFKATEPGS